MARRTVDYKMVERILLSEGYHIGDASGIFDPRFPEPRSKPGTPQYGDWLESTPEVTVFGWWRKNQNGNPAIMTTVDDEPESENDWRVIEIEVMHPKSSKYMKIKMTASNIRKWAQYWA